MTAHDYESKLASDAILRAVYSKYGSNKDIVEIYNKIKPLLDEISDFRNIAAHASSKSIGKKETSVMKDKLISFLF